MLITGSPTSYGADRSTKRLFLEKDEAATIKATSITVPANHLALLSHPREVAESIGQASAEAR